MTPFNLSKVPIIKIINKVLNFFKKNSMTPTLKKLISLFNLINPLLKILNKILVLLSLKEN